MLQSPQRRFLFNAHAVGLAASFTKPKTEFLEAQAVAGLPDTGGMSSSRVENFRFHDLISFRLAYSHASGTYNQDTGAYNTLVTSVIEGLDIMGVVMADKLVSRLASRHFIDPPIVDRLKVRNEKGEIDPDGIPEPSIITLGSDIHNLKVAGLPVTLTPDLRILRDHPTYSGMLSHCERRPKETYSSENDVLTMSVFSQVQWGQDVQRGNRIAVEEFGTIYLGEIHMEAHQRRLSMIRFELGCSNEGDGSTNGVVGNGTPVPPLSS